MLGLFLLSRRDALTPLLVLRRAGAYIAGGIVGIIPLLIYNHYAFHSWTHLAYSDVPAPAEGLLRHRGAEPEGDGDAAARLARSADAVAGARHGRRGARAACTGAGKRAEALTIAGICVCYVGYNSGYYLPFGGGFLGPRFLATMLPFLAVPIAIALRRFPGPTVALAAASVFILVLATITHPLVGYENETVVWMRLLKAGNFQPTIASAYGAGRGWAGHLPVPAASPSRRSAAPPTPPTGCA